MKKNNKPKFKNIKQQLFCEITDSINTNYKLKTNPLPVVLSSA